MKYICMSTLAGRKEVVKVDVHLRQVCRQQGWRDLVPTMVVHRAGCPVIRFHTREGVAFQWVGRRGVPVLHVLVQQVCARFSFYAKIFHAVHKICRKQQMETHELLIISVAPGEDKGDGGCVLHPDPKTNLCIGQV